MEADIAMRTIDVFYQLEPQSVQQERKNVLLMELVLIIGKIAFSAQLILMALLHFVLPNKEYFKQIIIDQNNTSLTLRKY